MAQLRTNFLEGVLEGMDKREIAQLARKFLTTDLLPMGDIQRWLEQKWRPNANDLLAQGSIGADLIIADSIGESLLADDIPITKFTGLDAGMATVTWTAAAANSNVLTVNHGCGSTPTAVVATTFGAADVFPAIQGASLTSTQFNIFGTTKTGTLAGTTRNVLWIAVVV